VLSCLVSICRGLFSSHDQQLQELLCAELLALPPSHINRYLLQYVYMAVARPCGPLERTLTQLCGRSFNIAVQVCGCVGLGEQGGGGPVSLCLICSAHSMCFCGGGQALWGLTQLCGRSLNIAVQVGWNWSREMQTHTLAFVCVEGGGRREEKG
jgi:hypothetical protein